MSAAQANAAQLNSEFAARCAAIDAQLRQRLSGDVELEFLSGIRAWTATLAGDMAEAIFAQSIADIPVDIAPDDIFTAL